MSQRFLPTVLGLSALALLGALFAARTSAAKPPPLIPASGQILIAGGITGEDFLPTGAAEVFDPETQTFAAAATMKPAREEVLGLAVPIDATSKLAGKLLFLGGEKFGKKNFPHLKSSSVFDPATGKFKRGPGLKKQVEDGAVVALGDGRFLLLAGEATKGKAEFATNSAMLFDSSTGKVAALKNGMTTPRRNMAAARVGCKCNADGKVLITGGVDENDDALDSAELFDPATLSFTATGSMNVARNGHTATALPDGTVLICGGFTGPGNTAITAEVYDPVTGSFTLTTDLNGGNGTDMGGGHAFHMARLLPDGTVLVAGGEEDIFGGGDHATSAAVIYDPATATFTETANDMSDPRTDAFATLIVGTSLDGQVLITGGEDFGNGDDVLLATADLYDPATKTFTPTTGTMVTPRSEHAALQVP